MIQEGRISYAIDGNKVVFHDNQLKGTLILYFKPLNPKQGSDLMYGTLNDILLSLKRKELTLELFGITRIDVQKDVILKGKIFLKSSFLFDPELNNSKLHFVSIKSRCIINESEISHFGDTRHGLIRFDHCSISKEDFVRLPAGREITVINNQIH